MNNKKYNSIDAEIIDSLFNFRVYVNRSDELNYEEFHIDFNIDHYKINLLSSFYDTLLIIKDFEENINVDKFYILQNKSKLFYLNHCIFFLYCEGDTIALPPTNKKVENDGSQLHLYWNYSHSKLNNEKPSTIILTVVMPYESLKIDSQQIYARSFTLYRKSEKYLRTIVHGK